MSTGSTPILAVDDSLSIREIIVTALVAKGYRVTSAVNGLEALQRLRAATEPHIVLLDIVMPLMDGIAVVNGIEQDAALKAIGHKFILMSSATRLLQSDIPPTAGQLAKPFTRPKLLEIVEAVESAP